MRKLPLTMLILALVGIVVPARAQEDIALHNMEHVATIPFTQGTHLEFMTRTIDGVERTFALAGERDDPVTNRGGLHIIDITDPTAPEEVSFVPCAQRANDIAVTPDGNTIILTADGGLGCIAPSVVSGYQRQVRDIGIVDVTDLSRPRLLGQPLGLLDMHGVHTAVMHPSLPIAYLSSQELADRSPDMWILDLSGVKPVVTGAAMPIVGSTPHDTTFNAVPVTDAMGVVHPPGSRAYVSAITASYILDSTDPLHPVVLSHIVDPSIDIHHEAMLSPNGRYLLVTDELGGGTLFPAPQCPGGVIHVYDLFNELAPIPVGVIAANDTRTLDVLADDEYLPTCTSHEGNFTADGNMLAIGWYFGGARVFDVSSLNQAGTPPFVPVIVNELAFARPNAVRTWAAKFHPNAPGYVFATNTKIGFEVYRLTLP